MKWEEFAERGAEAARWAAEYHRTLRDRPVRASTRPGEILAQLPEAPPEEAEPLDSILEDFDRTIVPGMTHWQHPRFFAYFPANAAPVSALAEAYVTAMAANCLLWQTSPAGTELETRVMDWLRLATGLPGHFTGVIQDSASTATLCAVLTMRERALNWAGNRAGLSGQPRLRIYASTEVHTSIDRAIWIAGSVTKTWCASPPGVKGGPWTRRPCAPPSRRTGRRGCCLRGSSPASAAPRPGRRTMSLR